MLSYSQVTNITRADYNYFGLSNIYNTKLLILADR